MESNMADMRPPIESGCPDPFQYMHPLMIKNYGNWVSRSSAPGRAASRRQERR
jgi:hypothetical protein